jgi:antitoxin VapB
MPGARHAQRPVSVIYFWYKVYNVAMSIKNRELEQLAHQLSRLMNSSKTEAIRQALKEKKERLDATQGLDRKQRLLSYLENRVWPSLPKGASRRWTKAQEARALGYGKQGEPS